MGIGRSAFALLLLVLGCGPSDAAPADGGATAPTSTAIASVSATASAAAAPEPAAEARRRTVAELDDEPMLTAHAATVREHFADAGPLPALGLQFLRSQDRVVALLADGGPGPPLLLALDLEGGDARRSTIAWSKDLPLAGTFPGATELALAGGPMGEVAIAWFDPTTKLVGVRKWRHDGGVLADFVLGGLDACDAISALFWPERGWVVAASQLGDARAFLLTENGGLAWGRGGVQVSLGREASAPLSLAIDGDAVVLAGVGTSRSSGKRAPEHALAFRLSAAGEPEWREPVDLGPAPPGSTRIPLSARADGGVEVRIGDRRVTLGSNGTLERR